MSDDRLQLTDGEWMSLIDGERAGGLARCCANISELRDDLIAAARAGGEVHPFLLSRLRQHLGWVVDTHDVAGIPALRTVCEQLGIAPDGLRHEPAAGPEIG